jgi:hemolysin III
MTSSTPPSTSSPAKPLLRGVSHQIAFFVALPAAAVLARSARPGAQFWAAIVFGASLLTLFGVSALYHRVDWGRAGRARMRRLDHSAIFLLIAGGYTPLLVLVPRPGAGRGALAAIWIGATLGVAKSLLWPHAPKWLMPLLCVGLGWVGVGEVLARASFLGHREIAALAASGVLYSLGALVYAVKRPDPFPRVFGYHEVFHALVIAASALLFAHVAFVLRAT